MEQGTWGFRFPPFSDDAPPWFFRNASHDEALARMEYLVGQKRCCGIVTGAPGTGKTLLLRLILERLRRTGVPCCLLDVAGFDAGDTLWALNGAVGLAPSAADSPAQLWRRLSDALQGSDLAGERRVFLLDHIDLADAGCHRLLGRLLHEAPSAGSRCVLLTSRPDVPPPLAQLVARHAGLRIELVAFNETETGAIVNQAVQRAGGRGEIFAPDALAAIYERTGGEPRQIARLCHLALFAAEAEQQPRVDRLLIEAVASELSATGSLL